MASSNIPPESIALIGYGYWGKRLRKYIESSAGFKLAHIYFPSLKNNDAVTIQKKWGPEFTSDLNQIWNNRTVSNVVIATPIATHYDVVREALSHGKNVLVEKPLTFDAQQAQHLAELASRQNLLLQTEYTYTYSRALQQAQKLIKEGAIGAVRSVTISFRQLGRFLAYDVYLLLGSHALSILDLFFPLQELSFEAIPLMKVNGITTEAMIRFVSKTTSQDLGFIDLSLHCPEKSKKAIIYGDRGTILYDPSARESLILTTYRPVQTEAGDVDIQEQKKFAFDENHNLQLAIDHFYEVIKRKSDSNIERAVLINEVLDSLREKVVQS